MRPSPSARLGSKRSRPLVRRSLSLAVAIFAVGASAAVVVAQQLVTSRNVNMVAGTKWPDGDPYLQRQNEPSIAASTRNPLHLLAGANDYRTVDVPFVDGAAETGDAWLGLFKSSDGGQRWKTSLLPGYPQDTSPEGMASPLKGYTAGADPVVRAGTNGLFYFNGLVFTRSEAADGRSGIFVARFIDNNDQEAGDTIKYLGTSLVASSPGGPNAPFLDKPWLAVDIPRGNGTCRIVTNDVDPKTQQPRNITQTVPAGPVYVTFASFTQDAEGPRSDIYFTRSTDCGVTWATPVRVNNVNDRANQGASMAIDPRSGDVYVTWRRFAPSLAEPGDGVMIARFNSKSRKFLPPGIVRQLPSSKFENILDRINEKRRVKTSAPTAVDGNIEPFDQATTDITESISFRTNAYPTLAIDGSGRHYLAWAERGFGTARPSPVDGDARIVMSTSNNGTHWSAPRPVADETQGPGGVPLPGHQFMPTMTIGAGRVVLVYYDLRDDLSQTFTPFADDRQAILNSGKRRTLDLRATIATLGETPVFDPSVRVSDYLVRQLLIPAGNGQLTVAEQQMQFNVPNLPMFVQGTAPFMGDYVDITTAPAFVPAGAGRWTYNTSGQVAFHAVWTDNRDVKQPGEDTNGDGNPWNDYTAPTQRALTNSPSIFDPTQTLPMCTPANTGSRNQNIYTARLSFGLIAGSPGNTKPLSPTLQRAFSVFAQNTTLVPKRFRMTIANQPPGGRASFDQFSAQPLVAIDVSTPPRSLAARTVYATSTQPDAPIAVTVVEIDAAGGVVTNGLSDVIHLNPDLANPDLANPDLANPDLANPDIANAEVYNPDLANPDLANPDLANPDLANPDLANPDLANPDLANPDLANPVITNVVVANPDLANPDLANPDLANPDLANPDLANPDLANPDLANTTLTDVTWTVTNTGNTAASFNVNLFLAQETDKICAADESPSGDGCIATQLILTKSYSTPTALACELQVQTQTILIANIVNPRFVTPGTAATTPNDPSANNATLWLGPGETARITLRIADPDGGDNTTFGTATIDPIFVPTTTGDGGVLTPFVTQQAVNTTDVGAGGVIQRYPASVFFVQQPTTTPLGFNITPAVTVQVRDQLGSPLPNATVMMSLVNPAPGGAILLGGEGAITDANGIAVFAALQVDRAGGGYQLEASVIDASSTIAISNKSLLFDVPLVVVNTNDSGVGSLRHALETANMTVGLRETIVFAIPGPGPHLIEPQLAALPEIVDPVVIDARTQPGYAPRSPAVIVSAAHVVGESVFAAIQVDADNTEIRGLFVRDSDAYGIRVRGNNATITDNVLSANQDAGISVQGDDARVANNVIGLSAGGVGPALPNDVGIDVSDRFVLDGETSTWVAVDNVVIEDNVVSGNNVAGILVRATVEEPQGTRISRNWIGVDASGLLMYGNGAAGNGGGIVLHAGQGTVIGGGEGNGNTIGGNIGAGIAIGTTILDVGGDANNVTVVGNYIGTNAIGMSLGNTTGGILIRNGSLNAIGGDAQVAGTQNVIWNNGGPGVGVTGGSVSNLIRFNSIYGNAGLGIDLGAAGVNTNDGLDSDDGPNHLQNHPILEWAQNDIVPGRTTVRGTLSSRPSTSYRLRVYSNATCDPTGFGEGEIQEDTLLIATNGDGLAIFESDLVGPTVVGPVALGRFVTVTVTPLTGPDFGSTSEFSNCVPVTAAAPAFVVTNTNDAGPGSLRDAMVAANAAPDMNVISFAIPGASAAEPAMIVLESALPRITAPVIIDATTQPGWTTLANAYTPFVEVNADDTAMPATDGVFDVYSSDVQIKGLAITNSPKKGIFVFQTHTGIVIQYNAIGTDALGSAAKGSVNEGVHSRAGGEGPASNRILNNVIAGNGGAGLLLDLGAHRHLVEGNYIGAVNLGTVALPNPVGVVMYDGVNANVLLDNVIGGNTFWGIEIQQSGILPAVNNNEITGNRIGVQNDGTTPLPNGAGGINLQAGVSNQITNNVIAHNNGPGLWLRENPPGFLESGNSVLGSRFFDNAGLGIDIGAIGVTANTPLGPRNFPTLIDSVNDDGETVVDYEFNGPANATYTIEFFANASCDSSGYGEGETLLATTLFSTDETGAFNGSIALPLAGYGSTTYAARVHTAESNVSEFSNCLAHEAPEGIASVTPAAVGSHVSEGQMVVIRGTNLPVNGESSVIYTSGETELTASYLFSGNSNLVIARTPGGLPPGPGTIRISNGFSTTPAYPVTFSGTPGAPVLTSLRNECNGADINEISAGQNVYVLADGVDTSNTRFYWTQVGGDFELTAESNFTTGGPGSVCTQTTVPGGLTGGAWELRITTRGSSMPESPRSNVILTLIVD